ncbi:MAG TPA: type II toxin-antitoxin system VapC family toxin [Solirubrobacteraceae bacterium]|nr:type II toxin-antitoxin system VapC family toxin [Solirubrobacteraceae bacterium]
MVVADSSAFVEVLIASVKAEKVRRALEGQQIHAPDLISFEVLSAIRGKVRGRKLTDAEGLAAMVAFEGVEDNLQLWPLLDVMSEHAIQLRENVSSYDATYVTLAKILPCPLVTADARLGRAVQRLIDVIVV